MFGTMIAETAVGDNPDFWAGFDLFLGDQPMKACQTEDQLRGWMYGNNSRALATMPDDFVEGLRDLAAGAPRHCPEGIDWATVEDQPWN